MPAVYLWQNDQSRLVYFMILTDCPDEPMPALTTREVCQVLRDSIFGRRVTARAGAQDWDRFGADPIALLSTWEHRSLELISKALRLDHSVSLYSPLS